MNEYLDFLPIKSKSIVQTFAFQKFSNKALFEDHLGGGRAVTPFVLLLNSLELVDDKVIFSPQLVGN